MTALPIYTFYKDDWSLFDAQPNSYLGLSLWEALSNRYLSHPSYPGILDYEFPVLDKYDTSDGTQDSGVDYLVNRIKLKGKLKFWPANAFGQHWSSSLKSNEKSFSELKTLKSFAKRPIIKSSNKVNGTRTFTDLDINQFVKEEVQPLSPIIKRDTNRARSSKKPHFFAHTTFIRNAAVSELNLAATFQSQAHLFVVDAILKRVSRVFELDDKYINHQILRKRERNLEQFYLKRRKSLANEMRALDKRGVSSCIPYSHRLEINTRLKSLIADNKFNLTAGSYLYGGQFPPHLTHRNGIHYDISFGPDLIPWDISKASELLRIAYPWLAKKGLLTLNKEDMPLAILDGTTFKGVYRIYKVNQVPKDVCRSTLRVTHNFMRTYKNDVFNNLKGVISEISFEEAERLFYGTPHFRTKEDGELAHVGHCCILLSAPFRIVYGSPIIHLRTLRAINQAANNQDEIEKTKGKEPRYLDLVKMITSQCDFAFLPHNHHHHWHIYYWIKDKGSFNQINKFSIPSDLWLRMKIDLRPFTKYLKAHSDKHLRPAGKDYSDSKVELDALLKFLSQYEQKYKLLYEDPEDNSEDERADEFILDIFKRFVSYWDGTLLEPVGEKPPMREKQSEEKDSMYTHGTNLKKHLLKILNLIKANLDESEDAKTLEKLIPKINETFTYDELKEVRASIDPKYWEEAIMMESYYDMDFEEVEE
jgi:hypothetical protein